MSDFPRLLISTDDPVARGSAQVAFDLAQIKPILSAYEDTPLGIDAVLPSNRYVPHRVQVLIEHLAHTLRS